MAKVKIKQAGGKYGEFVCPVCGYDKAAYKFTAASGWCDKCEAHFNHVGGPALESVRDDGKHGDFWMELEIEL